MKPWDEIWTVGDYFTVRLGAAAGNRGDVVLDSESESPGALDRVRLAAAAPAMARALCLVEWSVNVEGVGVAMCPACEGLERWWEDCCPGHSLGGCIIDKALTAAGLDAAAREAVRKAAR